MAREALGGQVPTPAPPRPRLREILDGPISHPHRSGGPCGGCCRCRSRRAARGRPSWVVVVGGVEFSTLRSRYQTSYTYE